MLRFRWITFDRFKVVNLSRFYRVNFIRPYWGNFTVFSTMKRKSFVSILIVLLALFSLTRCKLAEVETIDEIPCPGVGIDTVIIPGWDNQPDD